MPALLVAADHRCQDVPGIGHRVERAGDRPVAMVRRRRYGRVGGVWVAVNGVRAPRRTGLPPAVPYDVPVVHLVDRR